MRSIKVKYEGEKPFSYYNSAAFDLSSAEDFFLEPMKVKLVPTNLRIEAPLGYFSQVCSRSGLASKGIFVLNSPGIIDNDYRGEIKVLLLNVSPEDVFFKKGQRIAQLFFVEQINVRWEQSPLNQTGRKEKGIGSSDLSQ